LLIHSWRRKRRVGQGADVKLLKKGIVEKMQGKPQMNWERMEETAISVGKLLQRQRPDVTCLVTEE
jgi:hypothetical protein